MKIKWNLFETIIYDPDCSLASQMRSFGIIEKGFILTNWNHNLSSGWY